MGVKFLGPKELADKLGISVHAVYRRRSDGAPMPPALAFGKLLRWSEDEVDEWMLGQREVAA